MKYADDELPFVESTNKNVKVTLKDQLTYGE